MKKNDPNASAVLRDSKDVIDIYYKDHKYVVTLITEKDKEINEIETVVYEHSEEVFIGNNFINTNICLYSKENFDKNFEISFDINRVGSNNKAHSTILSSMDESGSPWPGHNVKVQVNSNNEQYLKIESNSNTSSTGDVTIPSNVKNVKIVRINHILYYSFDNKNLVKLNDFTGFTDYFDVPLTFGGALDGNNQPIRYFDGDLANIYVSFLNDNITVMKYNEINNNVTLAYQHIEPIVFDGTNNINTNLKLFNKENATLDFELSFNIDKFGTGFETQSTLVNGKLESGGYPGFVYRFTSDGKKLEFTAKGGTEKSRASTNISKINHVSIIRKDEKMYVNINSGNEILVYDFTNFTDYHDMPLIIGSSLKSDGKTGFRYFIGTLSNIFLYVENK